MLYHCTCKYTTERRPLFSGKHAKKYTPLQFDYFYRMLMQFNLEELPAIAKKLIDEWKQPRCIAISGQMGAGKTTMVHAFCDALGVTDAVGSPTFSIINEYGLMQAKVYHIDCYRLRDENEAIDAGVEDCLFSGQWCFVEWPEKIPHLFPDETLRLNLQILTGNTRQLEINSGFNL